MKFKGLVVAANTPFQSDLELDLERIPSLTDYLVGQKLAGLFVCGSTGECSGMTAPERKAAAGAFIKAAEGRIPVIVHVGSDGVRESQELAGSRRIGRGRRDRCGGAVLLPAGQRCGARRCNGADQRSGAEAARFIFTIFRR